MSRRDAAKFDWDSYWVHEGEGEQMRMGADNMAARISRLISSTNAASVADVGCGLGRTISMLALAHPTLRFTGFDASSEAVRGCEQRARDLGLSNLRFKMGSLPSLAHKGRFDLVLCIATLHYVKDVKAGLQRLWSLVEPGGTLVFNYPNRFTMHAYRRWVAEMDDPSLSKRFALLLAGDNLLTLEDIRRLLGARPRSLWTIMGEKSIPSNVCVVVRRPPRLIRRSSRGPARKPS